DEHQIAPQRDATVVRPAAVDALDVLADLRVVAPFLPTRPRVNREDARLVRGQVQHALIDERGRLQTPVVATGREHPGRAQARDVGRRDLRESYEALGERIAAIGEPRRVVARGVFELRRRDRLRPDSCDARQKHEHWRNPMHGSSVPADDLTERGRRQESSWRETLRIYSIDQSRRLLEFRGPTPSKSGAMGIGARNAEARLERGAEGGT